MRNTQWLFLILLFFFIGYILNVSNDNQNTMINDKLKDFEDKIIISDNTYVPEENTITDNIFNKGGKKIEGIIDGGFDFLFNIVKGIIDEK